MKIKFFILYVGVTVMTLMILLIASGGLFEYTIAPPYQSNFTLIFFSIWITTIIISRKKWRKIVSIIGILGLVILLNQYRKIGLSTDIRKEIPNTHYILIVTPHYYKILKKKYFLEVTIAEKSTMFFLDDKSKTGLSHISTIQSDILLEDSDKIILKLGYDFKTTIDTLSKR